MSLSHFSRRAETLSFHHLNGNVNHSTVRNALTYSQREVCRRGLREFMLTIWRRKKNLWIRTSCQNPSEVMEQLADWKPKSGEDLVRTGHQLVLFLYVGAKCCHLSVLECNRLQRLTHKCLCLRQIVFTLYILWYPIQRIRSPHQHLDCECTWKEADWLCSMFPTSFECSAPAAVLSGEKKKNMWTFVASL